MRFYSTKSKFSGEKLNQINTKLILQYLLNKKITRTEFCKLHNISYYILNKIINGADNVKLFNIKKLAMIIGCETKEMFT